MKTYINNNSTYSMYQLNRRLTNEEKIEIQNFIDENEDTLEDFFMDISDTRFDMYRSVMNSSMNYESSSDASEILGKEKLIIEQDGKIYLQFGYDCELNSYKSEKILTEFTNIIDLIIKNN